MFDIQGEDKGHVLKPLLRGHSGADLGNPTGVERRRRKSSMMAQCAKHGVSAVAITGMLISWIASAELVQGLTDTYNKPFMICYVTRLGWTVCLVGWAVWRAWYMHTTHSEMALRPEGAFTWSYYIPLSIALCFLGFGSGITWYISLRHTPVSGNTALYQTAPVMVFLLSIPLLKERVNCYKVMATVFCVAGALVVSLTKPDSTGCSGHAHAHNHTNTTGYYEDMDTEWGPLSYEPFAEPGGVASMVQGGKVAKPCNGTSSDALTDTTYGYFMVFLSTFMYATFEVLYKKLATRKNDPFPLANSQRFLGLIGLSVALFTPLFPFLDYIGFEEFEWPPPHAMRLIGLNVALDTVFNVSLLVTILLTSPLFCSLATILTIPVSMLADVIMGKPGLPTVSYSGIFLIVVGYLCLAVSEMNSRKKKADIPLYE